MESHPLLESVKLREIKMEARGTAGHTIVEVAYTKGVDMEVVSRIWILIYMKEKAAGFPDRLNVGGHIKESEVNTEAMIKC